MGVQICSQSYMFIINKLSQKKLQRECLLNNITKKGYCY